MDEKKPNDDASRTLIIDFGELPRSLDGLVTCGLSKNHLYFNLNINYKMGHKTEAEVNNELETFKKELCKFMGKMPSALKVQSIRIDDV